MGICTGCVKKGTKNKLEERKKKDRLKFKQTHKESKDESTRTQKKSD